MQCSSRVSACRRELNSPTRQSREKTVARSTAGDSRCRSVALGSAGMLARRTNAKTKTLLLHRGQPVSERSSIVINAVNYTKDEEPLCHIARAQLRGSRWFSISSSARRGQHWRVNRLRVAAA